MDCRAVRGFQRLGFLTEVVGIVVEVVAIAAPFNIIAASSPPALHAVMHAVYIVPELSAWGVSVSTTVRPKRP